MNYCINCGRPGTHQHHIVPESLGGNNSTNIVWLCDECHGKIHNIQYNNGQLSHSELVKIGIEKARNSNTLVTPLIGLYDFYSKLNKFIQDEEENITVLDILDIIDSCPTHGTIKIDEV